MQSPNVREAMSQAAMLAWTSDECRDTSAARVLKDFETHILLDEYLYEFSKIVCTAVRMHGKIRGIMVGGF